MFAFERLPLVLAWVLATGSVIVLLLAGPSPGLRPLMGWSFVIFLVFGVAGVVYWLLDKAIRKRIALYSKPTPMLLFFFILANFHETFVNSVLIADRNWLNLAFQVHPSTAPTDVLSVVCEEIGRFGFFVIALYVYKSALSAFVLNSVLFGLAHYTRYFSLMLTEPEAKWLGAGFVWIGLTDAAVSGLVYLLVGLKYGVLWAILLHLYINSTFIGLTLGNPNLNGLMAVVCSFVFIYMLWRIVAKSESLKVNVQ